MDSIVSWFLAILITFPILSYILVYKVIMKITKEKKRSVLKTFDIGSFLLLICIHYTSMVVLGKSLLGFTLLVSVFIFLVVGVIQKKVGDFSMRKSLKRGWRSIGLIYMMGYIVLFNYGLFLRIIE